ncbi:hypothetical protein G9464_14385 [Halostella sp. JP-L12]|uniref:DUF7545 family protein n=1 Tax=Halostella TaxID=1843185 RepID=UPI000EF82126|nr:MULTISPECIES: hypothetical protein [Halostella]NHN48773.1 hypothetical protein [Halostella sp. JP-L12]
MTDTITVSLESSDGGDDEIELPAALVEMLSEEDDEAAATVVGDIALFGCAQRIHGAIHHSQGEPSEEIQSVEADTMEIFEERFGATFEELTGHDH